MSLEATAFKVLYPDKYFSKFFENKSRPDGRSLNRCRATTIGFRAVSSSDSSSLVKIGSTTALATLKINPCNPDPWNWEVGGINIEVEITPLCKEDCIPGRFGDWGKTIARRIQRLFDKNELVSGDDWKIPDTPARWGVSIIVSILDADGSVFDAAFLACVSALKGAKFPKVEVDSLKRVTRVERGNENGDGNEGGGLADLESLKLRCLPVSVTFGVLGEFQVADPTADEERVMNGSVSVVVNDTGELLGLFQVGEVSLAQMRQCIEVAKSRHKEVDELMQDAMQALKM